MQNKDHLVNQTLLMYRLINCSMSCPRKMSYFELSPLLLKRVKLIPAALHLFASMSPLAYLKVCCSWTCCKKSSRNWKKRIWFFDPRYSQLNSHSPLP